MMRLKTINEEDEDAASNLTTSISNPELDKWLDESTQNETSLTTFKTNEFSYHPLNNDDGLSNESSSDTELLRDGTPKRAEQDAVPPEEVHRFRCHLCLGVGVFITISTLYLGLLYYLTHYTTFFS